jgi:hypothetical protein
MVITGLKIVMGLHTTLVFGVWRKERTASKRKVREIGLAAELQQVEFLPPRQVFHRMPGSPRPKAPVSPVEQPCMRCRWRYFALLSRKVLHRLSFIQPWGVSVTAAQ